MRKAQKKDGNEGKRLNVALLSGTKQRGATVYAEMPLLLMLARRMRKAVRFRFAHCVYYRSLFKVRGYAKSASRSALAVLTMAYAVHHRCCVDSDVSVPAGACCCHSQLRSCEKQQFEKADSCRREEQPNVKWTTPGKPAPLA